MFGSTVLEVVIGLVFLYLSLSLTCSALNEYYSALASRRAAHLRDSLYTIFNKDDPKGLAFLLEFYSHPLISGLSPSKRAATRGPIEDLSLKLPWYQAAVVVPARVGADVVGWVVGLVRSILGGLRWVGEVLRDPHGVGGGHTGLRKELAQAARSTPTYIPDNAFSGAIFAVLASDSGALLRLRVELNEQLAALGKLFEGLDDPATAKSLAARLDDVGRALRADVEKAKAPEEIMRLVQPRFDDLLAAIPDADPSYQAALDLIAAPAVLAAGPTLDGIRKALTDGAAALPDGASKQELARLAGQKAWFAKLPDAATYLAKLKVDLEDREKARSDARERVGKSLRAVLAVGPQMPTPERTRDHVWLTLETSIRRLAAALGALPDGPLRAGLTPEVDRVLDAIGPQKAAPPMSLDQARQAKNQAFDAIRTTLADLKTQVDWSKAAGWVEKEAASLANAEADLITIAKLRDAVDALPESDLRVALRSLMDEVGDDLEHVKRNIQSWYNDTMERVSGWYKRNTQVILAMIALTIAMALNADTLAIADKLWKDSTLRANVNALAKSVAPETLEKKLSAIPKTKEAASLKEQEKSVADQMLEQTGIPLGWSQEELKRVGCDPESLQPLKEWAPPKWTQVQKRALLAKALGLLLTAIAASMGAPFWFDVLNKLVNVRTAGLQPAKTADKRTTTPPKAA